MTSLHSWNVSVEEAIQIQEALKNRIILKKTFLKVKAMGGGDVAYSKNWNLLFGAIVILSFPDMEILDMATADGQIPFPYIPTLLTRSAAPSPIFKDGVRKRGSGSTLSKPWPSGRGVEGLTFREGPILIKTFQRLKVKPDVMIFDGQGIAHPRGMGLASHMGLWLNLPSIGCAKTALLDEFISPGPSKGSYEWIRREGKKVGAVLRTKENVKPLFVSPGHRIDLSTSIHIILESCRGFRFPEPLRKAHQASRTMLNSY